MLSSIPHFHYFSYKSNREIKEIFWMAVLNGLAIAMALIFEPIFLYQSGFRAVSIMWYYVQVYCWYLVLLMFGAKFATKFGFKRAILISNLIYPIYWLVLYHVRSHIGFFALAPFLFALQKCFFWPAFNSLAALDSVARQRGRQMGLVFGIGQIAAMIGPLIAGWISQKLGFEVLFAMTSCLIVLSSVPLFRSAEIYPGSEFSIWKLVAFARRNKRNIIGYWGYAEDLMLMSLWPLLTFIVVKGYLGVGFINTFASIVAAVLMLYIGRAADQTEKPKLIEAGSFFYGLTWLFRFVAVDPISVMIFDSLTKIGKALVNIPMISLTYDIARLKNSGFSLMYVVFFETSLTIGKILTGLSAIVILSFTNNIYLVFVLVGVLTFFYSFLNKKVRLNES